MANLRHVTTLGANTTGFRRCFRKRVKPGERGHRFSFLYPPLKNATLEYLFRILQRKNGKNVFLANVSVSFEALVMRYGHGPGQVWRGSTGSVATWIHSCRMQKQSIYRRYGHRVEPLSSFYWNLLQRNECHRLHPFCTVEGSHPHRNCRCFLRSTNSSLKLTSWLESPIVNL